MKKSNTTLLYLLILLLVLGLACQTVTGALENPTAESVTIAAELPTPELELPPTEEPPVEEPTTDSATAVPEEMTDPTELPALIDVLEIFEGLSAGHENDPVYFDKDMPAPGGVHAGIWQNCGIYTEPVEAKHAIHSLEHGAVWLTYDPELPEEDVMVLQELASNQAYTILSPFPGLRSPVIMVAWGLRFQTDTVTDPRILEFLLTYQQGPTTPELGAPCQGGIGTPAAPGTLGFSSS